MHAVLRAGALSAIAGGGLKIADSFTTQLLSAGTLTVFYLVTDVFLLAGIAGIWWKRRPTLGMTGSAGVGIFVIGILAIRVSAFGALRASGYQLGATIALVGLSAYSFETLFRRSAAPWAPIVWLVSLASGMAVALGAAPEAMMALAGVTFGAGFVAAGAELITR